MEPPAPCPKSEPKSHPAGWRTATGRGKAYLETSRVFSRPFLNDLPRIVSPQLGTVSLSVSSAVFRKFISRKGRVLLDQETKKQYNSTDCSFLEPTKYDNAQLTRGRTKWVPRIAFEVSGLSTYEDLERSPSTPSTVVKCFRGNSGRWGQAHPPHRRITCGSGLLVFGRFGILKKASLAIE